MLLLVYAVLPNTVFRVRGTRGLYVVLRGTAERGTIMISGDVPDMTCKSEQDFPCFSSLWIQLTQGDPPLPSEFNRESPHFPRTIGNTWTWFALGPIEISDWV